MHNVIFKGTLLLPVKSFKCDDGHNKCCLFFKSLLSMVAKKERLVSKVWKESLFLFYDLSIVLLIRTQTHPNHLSFNGT